MNMTTIDLLNILENNQNISLKQLLEKIPDLSFLDYLKMLMETKGIKRSDLVRKTIIERTYIYQITNGTRIPSQNKVLQIALALSLNLHDTNVLLTLAGHGNLYPKIKRDALIIFGINHHYDLFQVNDLLYEYQFPLIE